MKLVVNPKNKKQEKKLKEFLAESAIDFTIAEEEAAVYKTAPKKAYNNKEKEILRNLDQSIDFIKKYRKGKTRSKSIKQLLNEL